MSLKEASNISLGTSKGHSTLLSNHLLGDDGKDGKISESYEHRPTATLLLLNSFFSVDNISVNEAFCT